MVLPCWHYSSSAAPTYVAYLLSLYWICSRRKKRLHKRKTLGLLQPYICLSHCISVTVIQRMLPTKWVFFRKSIEELLITVFSRPIWLHFWHFYHNHATKELLQRQMLGSKQEHRIAVASATMAAQLFCKAKSWRHFRQQMARCGLLRS